MYRFLLRPRWLLFHVAVVGAIVVMVNLGFWQLGRLDERREFNDAVRARIDEHPVALDELVPPDAEVGDDALDDIEWRPVTVSGRYEPDEEVRVYNRSQGGVAGDNVVTPLLLDDGRVVLVVRGFVPLDAEPAAPPRGDVEVTGRLRRSEAAGVPGGEKVSELRRLDIPRLSGQLPGDAVPMFVELEQSRPAEQGPYPVPVAEPELTERNHLSYAVQWFLFSAGAAAGWILAVRSSAQRQRRIS
jgi:cytochrome oxidase assembly protein ShyY1